MTEEYRTKYKPLAATPGQKIGNVDAGMSLVASVGELARSAGQEWMELSRREKVRSVAAGVGGIIFAGGLIAGTVEGARLAEQYGNNHRPAPIEQLAPANSSHQTEFTGSNGQRVNQQTHEQAQEILAQLHK